MTFIRILTHIGILYCFFLLGSWIQATLDLFIPGSIIGMILFFIALKLGWIKVEWVEEGTALLIRHLPLLFLPVTIGIMEYFNLFAGNGIILIFIVLVSTAVVMLTAGKVSNWVAVSKEKVASHE